MMEQGLAALQVNEVVGKTVPGPFQFRPPGPGLRFTVPTSIVPVPCVPPGPTPKAPVGIVLMPNELLSARKDSQLIVSKMIPKPARITVLPSAKGSHATPNLGAKLL